MGYDFPPTVSSAAIAVITMPVSFPEIPTALGPDSITNVYVSVEVQLA